MVESAVANQVQFLCWMLTTDFVTRLVPAKAMWNCHHWRRVTPEDEHHLLFDQEATMSFHMYFGFLFIICKAVLTIILVWCFEPYVIFTCRVFFSTCFITSCIMLCYQISPRFHSRSSSLEGSVILTGDDPIGKRCYCRIASINLHIFIFLIQKPDIAAFNNWFQGKFSPCYHLFVKATKSWEWSQRVDVDFFYFSCVMSLATKIIICHVRVPGVSTGVHSLN